MKKSSLIRYCHRESGRTPYRLQAKPAPLTCDHNSHTQPWSAV